jgi:hypothetical protein
MKKKLNIQRPAGGHMWHLVPEGERRALCGFAPGDKITTRMGRNRARWAGRTEYTPKEDDSVDHICTKCLKKHRAANA